MKIRQFSLIIIISILLFWFYSFHYFIFQNELNYRSLVFPIVKIDIYKNRNNSMDYVHITVPCTYLYMYSGVYLHTVHCTCDTTSILPQSAEYSLLTRIYLLIHVANEKLQKFKYLRQNQQLIHTNLTHCTLSN